MIAQEPVISTNLSKLGDEIEDDIKASIKKNTGTFHALSKNGTLVDLSEDIDAIQKEMESMKEDVVGKLMGIFLL